MICVVLFCAPAKSHRALGLVWESSTLTNKIVAGLISDAHHPNIIPPSLPEFLDVTINLPWGGSSTSDILSMCLLNYVHLWVWPLFFRSSEKHLAAENRHSRSRAKLVRSSQVDRESWQRLITMNNEWLLGSLYKELFRFRHTLTIFSLSVWTAVRAGWLIATEDFTVSPLPLLNISTNSHCALLNRNQDLLSYVKMKVAWMQQILTPPTLPLQVWYAGQSDFSSFSINALFNLYRYR